jgi:hypothetical protein
MTIIRFAATVYGLFMFAVVAIALVLFGIAWLLYRWRARPSVPVRGIAPQAADAGDETDAVAEGGFAEPWPGIQTIDAIRAANPRLTDMHAYAIAQARQRLAIR